MPNALLDGYGDYLNQQASNMGSGSWWNPSRAVNGGLSAAGLFSGGLGAILNLGYGAYRGAQGLTSQNNEGYWGQLDPTEPGALQNAGNWLGSGIANLLGYGNPQMSMNEGMAGNNQSMWSGMGSSSSYSNGITADPSRFPSAQGYSLMGGNPSVGSSYGSAGGQDFGSQVASGFGTGWGAMAPSGAYNGTLFGGSEPDGRPKYAL